MKYETKLLLTGSGGDNFNPRAKLLISDGVSKEKIIYDTKSKNSWDEAVNTLAFIKSYNSRNAINASLPHLPSPISHLRSSINQMNSIIVITDPPHLLRVRYAWGKVFKHSGIKFTLVATEPDWWNAWKWWQNETSRKFVVTEYLKLAYFIYKYNFDSKYFDNGIEHGAKGIGETDNNDIGERLKIDEAVKKKWNDRIDKWNDYFGRAIDRSLRPVKKSP